MALRCELEARPWRQERSVQVLDTLCVASGSIKVVRVIKKHCWP